MIFSGIGVASQGDGEAGLGQASRGMATHTAVFIRTAEEYPFID